MAAKRFSDNELLHLLDKKSLNQAEAAKRLGVSRQAVYLRLNKLRVGAVKVTATRGVDEAFNRYHSAAAQFEKISESAHKILDAAMAACDGDQTAITKLSNRTEKINGQEVGIVLKLRDPRELALKAMAEIRKQLKLQVDILQVLSDVGTFAEFKDAVLDAIGEVSPEVRQEILKNINRRREIASAVQFQA